LMHNESHTRRYAGARRIWKFTRHGRGRRSEPHTHYRDPDGRQQGRPPTRPRSQPATGRSVAAPVAKLVEERRLKRPSPSRFALNDRRGCSVPEEPSTTAWRRDRPNYLAYGHPRTFAGLWSHMAPGRSSIASPPTTSLSGGSCPPC